MNTKQDIFELTADYFFQRSTAAENNAAGRGKSPFLTTLLRTGSPAESADKVENVFSIGKAIRLMEDDCTQKFTIRSLAHIAGMSSSCFRHKFVRTMGLPPMEYLMMLRLRKALLLLNGPASVGEVARQSGFRTATIFPASSVIISGIHSGRSAKNTIRES